MNDLITKSVLKYFPDTQAIYLFGTYGTEDEQPHSDVDIAVLLRPETAKEIGSLTAGELHHNLETELKKDVDLINLREVNTVLQKEVIEAECRIYCADEYSAEEFEMLVLSYYQKLNEERADIIKEALDRGRFYNI